MIDFGGTCDLAVWSKLLRDKGWSGPLIARTLGKSEGYVNNLVRIVERGSFGSSSGGRASSAASRVCAPPTG